MKEIITYSLLNGKDSDQYYKDIEAFTDSFLDETRQLTSQVVEAFEAYTSAKVNEAPSARDEYYFEFLMLGTLWQVYSGDAFNLEDAPQRLLTALSELRQCGGPLKPGIDFLKGVLSTLFLSPDLYDNVFVLEPTVDHLKKLINWLSATGEFDQEVMRLKIWQDFFESQPPDKSSEYIATAITLAGWFEIRSEEHLGSYTLNVDKFLREVRPSHYWREDVIFSGRRRVEYHLNMFGAEIMNRTNREAFLKTGFKAVLLPSCMCEKKQGSCMAQECSNGLRCVLCSNTCRVRQLTELGRQNGFEVFIITHESSAFSGNVNENAGTLGIVGIACALNLVSGGWKAKKLGLPAQCVLLDYCGCKNHWHTSGIVTDINLNRLKRIFEIKDTSCECL